VPIRLPKQQQLITYLISPLHDGRFNNNPNQYLPLHHLLSTFPLPFEKGTTDQVRTLHKPHTLHVLRAVPATIHPATMMWYSLLPPYLTVVETWIIRIAVGPNSRSNDGVLSTPA
jgi:hypothetical protein